MANVSLKWCSTASLQEWAEHHWYYLPEDAAEKNFEVWCETMHEILLELQSRNINTTLSFFDNTPEPKQN